MKQTIAQNNPQFQPTIEDSSAVTKYDSFGILSVKKSIWTPDPQKSIFLTSIQVTAPLSVFIILSNGENDFLSLRVTEPFATVRQHFSSALMLKTGNSLMIGTSEERIECNIFGAVSAVQVAYNSRSDFSNVNNATGLADGSVASLSSGLLSQTRGRIVLGYQMLPSSYEYFEIQQVVIRFYCRLSLTIAVGVSSMILYWRKNSEEDWTQLQQISLALIGTADYLSSPAEYDITDVILEASDPWEVINNLQTSFVGTHTGLGLGNVVQLDAVEIEVCMSGRNAIMVFGYEG